MELVSGCMVAPLVLLTFIRIRQRLKTPLEVSAVMEISIYKKQVTYHLINFLLPYFSSQFV
jgi:hypothetical protein